MENSSRSENTSSEDEMPILPLAESLPHGGGGVDREYGDEPPVLVPGAANPPRPRSANKVKIFRAGGTLHVLSSDEDGKPQISSIKSKRRRGKSSPVALCRKPKTEIVDRRSSFIVLASFCYPSFTELELSELTLSEIYQKVRELTSEWMSSKRPGLAQGQAEFIKCVFYQNGWSTLKMSDWNTMRSIFIAREFCNSRTNRPRLIRNVPPPIVKFRDPALKLLTRLPRTRSIKQRKLDIKKYSSIVDLGPRIDATKLYEGRKALISETLGYNEDYNEDTTSRGRRPVPRSKRTGYTIQGGRIRRSNTLGKNKKTVVNRFQRITRRGLQRESERDNTSEVEKGISTEVKSRNYKSKLRAVNRRGIKMEESLKDEHHEAVKVQSMVEALNAAIGIEDSFSDDFLNISEEEPEEPKPRINKENHLLTGSPSGSENMTEFSFDILEALKSDIDIYSQFSVSEMEYSDQAVVTEDGLTRKELESFEGLAEQLETHFGFQRVPILNPVTSEYTASPEVKIEHPCSQTQTPVSPQLISKKGSCNLKKNKTTAFNIENESKDQKLFQVPDVSSTESIESERRKKVRREELQCSLGSYWKINESLKGDDCAPRPKRPNAGAKLKALTQNELQNHKGIDFENRSPNKSTIKSPEGQKGVADGKSKSQYRVLPYERPVTRGVVRKEDRFKTTNESTTTRRDTPPKVSSGLNIGPNSSKAFGSDIEISPVCNEAESSDGSTLSKTGPANGNTVVITLNQAVATALKVPDSFTSTPQSEFIAKMKMKLAVQENQSKMDFATAYQKAKSLNLIHDDDDEPAPSPAKDFFQVGPTGNTNFQNKASHNQISVSISAAIPEQPALQPRSTVAHPAKTYSTRVKPIFQLPCIPELRQPLHQQQVQRTAGNLGQARGWSENRNPGPPLLNTPERLAILRHFEQARRLAESGSTFIKQQQQKGESKNMPNLTPSPQFARKIQTVQAVQKTRYVAPSAPKNNSSNQNALKDHSTNVVSVSGPNRAGKRNISSKQTQPINPWVDETLPVIFKLSNNKLLIDGKIISIDCSKLIKEAQVPLKFDPEVVVDVDDSDDLDDLVDSNDWDENPPVTVEETIKCKGFLFCELGCICESLNYKRSNHEHCKKAKCVLGCICGTKKMDPAFNDSTDIRSRLRPRNTLCNWRTIARAGEGKETEEEPVKVGRGRQDSKVVAEVVGRRRYATRSRSVDESLIKRPSAEERIVLAKKKKLSAAESPPILQSSPVKTASDSPPVSKITVPKENQKFSRSESEVETELESEMEAEWEADLELDRKLAAEAQRELLSEFESGLESELDEPEFDGKFDPKFQEEVDPEFEVEFEPEDDSDLESEFESESASDSETDYSLLRSLNGCTPCVVDLVAAPLSKPLSEIEFICAAKKLKLEHQFSIQTPNEYNSHICARGDISYPSNSAKPFPPAVYYRENLHTILTDSDGELACIIEWSKNKAGYPHSRVVTIGDPGVDEDECAVVSLVPPEDGYEWIFYSIPILPSNQGRIYLKGPKLILRITKLLQKQEQAVTENVVCRLLPDLKATPRCHPNGGLFILPDLPNIIIFGPCPIPAPDISKTKDNRIQPHLRMKKSQESPPPRKRRPIPPDEMKKELWKYIIKFIPISTALSPPNN